MWLTGDYRYVSGSDYQSFASGESEAMRETARQRFEMLKERGAVSGDFESRFPPGALALRRALSPDGKYGGWLMKQPLVVVINETAFTHAGFSEEYAGLGLEEINSRVANELERRIGAWWTLADAGIVAAEYPMLDAARALEPMLEGDALEKQSRRVREAAKALTDAPSGLIYQPDGPFWYRGMAACNPLAESALVYEALEGLGAETLVISHTPTHDERITQRLDGQLVRADTGGRHSALVVEDSAMEAVYTDREERRPVVEDESYPITNSRMTPDDVEEFLSEADVVHIEEVGAGVTNPQRVTLERDGETMRAIFKTEATPERSTGSISSRRLTDIADRHVYELAAYRLDRLLGLNMVPPAIERRIGRETGTLQYWVENATSERERRAKEIDPDPLCPLTRDYALLELFDRLIYNTDRTQENILYLPDWRVVLIDHTRSFRVSSGIPEGVREVGLEQAPELARRLEELDRGTLNRALGKYIDDRQIRALLQRRDEMLAEWRASGGDDLPSR